MEKLVKFFLSRKRIKSRMSLSPKIKRELFSSIDRTISTIDINTWEPFDPDSLIPYYLEPLVEKIIQTIKTLQEKGYSIRKIAQYFAGPTSIREEIGNCLYYDYTLSLPKKEITFYIDFLIKALSLFNSSDPFCFRGKNFFLETHQLRSLEKIRIWQKAEPETAKMLGKLIGTLLALSYSLYTDVWVASGSEFHGPYNLRKFDKEILIIRDFFDLAPTELWPSEELSRYKSIRILTLYNPIDLRFDFYGNFETKANLITNLKYWAILVNDKAFLTPQSFPKLIDYFAYLTSKQYCLVKNLNFEETKRKFMEAHYYRFRKLLEKVGASLQPTKEMYQAIKNKKLLSRTELNIRKHYQLAIERL